MQELFPPRQHYAIHDLPVDAVHSIHVREYGNRGGTPVVFLHGGPGSGCKPEHACFFNPEHYRIILFDQRGCGFSTPIGELTNNQTWDLIQDMETIRKHLNIHQWLLFAGSWGATLALIYAQKHARHVRGLILRGVFLARQQDIDWFFTDQGVARIFPEAWAEFSAGLSKPERKNPVAAYYQSLTSEDVERCYEAVRAWSGWSNAVVANGSGEVSVQSEQVVSDAMLAKVRIEAHYALHRYFLAENYILDHSAQIPEVPITIVHGRHDLVCLPESAFSLHQALPDSRLLMVDSGHLASEPEMTDALVKATEAFITTAI